jgi:hypothetical protein
MPIAHVVTLRTILATVSGEHHLLPSSPDIANGTWHVWNTPCYTPMTLGSNRCPWFYMPAYFAVTVPDGLDRPLVIVAPGEDGYEAALRAARARGGANLLIPDNAPVYSLYFSQTVSIISLQHVVELIYSRNASQCQQSPL